MTPWNRHAKNRRGTRGFSIVEAVMATAIVGIMTTSMLTSLSGSRLAMARTSDRAAGMLLAQAMMQEILTLPYSDPGGSLTIGPEAGEGGPDRSKFNDVDDYNGWAETPPAAKNGAAVNGAAGFTRSVAVDWVTTANLATTSATDKGVKRIVVTVKKGTLVLATLTAIRTNGTLDAAADQTVAPDADP